MPQKFLSIKNFEKYQSIRFATAPWFKVHKSFFGDREVTKLSLASRYLYIGLIYLATESNNKVYNDRTWIAQRLYMNPTEVNLTPLYKAGFLYTSNLSRELGVEESREEKSREEKSGVEGASASVIVDFDVFWKSYPRKEGKQDALKAWQKLNPDSILLVTMLMRLDIQKASDKWKEQDGKFIPHASTWLNGKRWEDELKPSNGSNGHALPKPPAFPPKNDPIARNAWRQAYGDPKQYGMSE